MVSGLAVCLLSATASASTVIVTQTNLVSDVPGLAAVTDPNLKNPWGMSFSATSPFWVSDTAANVTTVYNGAGGTARAPVAVPGGPTGQVFNSAGAGNFLVGGTASNFIFDTLGGSVYAWNNGAGGTAQLEATVAGASFTGLAIGNNGSGNFIYAANSAGAGGIVVFNSSFAQVSLAGSFVDPNLPAGYVPFNVQTISGKLYVEYYNPASQRVLGQGAVAVFDLNGNFIQQLIGPGGMLESPWGVVIAPSGFAGFAGDLLVGNFGNGQINAFDAATGAFLGTLKDSLGNPIVNSNLWALEVRPTGAFNPNAIYFDAGINRQADGLFGMLTSAVVTPEPNSLIMAASGCMSLIMLVRRKKVA